MYFSDTSLMALVTFILLKFYLISRLNIKILRTYEQGVDIHAEVLTGICKGQKLKKLRIIQEEESAEDETLFFQELVDLLLQYLEVDGHLFEDFDP